MRKFLVFLAGAILGAVITFVLYSLSVNSYSNNIRFYEEPGRNMHITSFEVVHSLDCGGAIAHAVNENDSDFLVLLMAKEGELFYDDQVVEVPTGKCAKQIGVFQHDKSNGAIRAIPVVDIYSE